MADEHAPPLSPQHSAPPEDGGADELFEFVDQPLSQEEADARESYLAECLAADNQKSSIPPFTPASDQEAVEPTEPTIESAPESIVPQAIKPTAPSKSGSILHQASESIGPHLDELRRRLVIAAFAFIPTFGAGLYFYQKLWDLLLLPLAGADPKLVRFQALAPSDGLILTMQVAFTFALILSTPVWVTQVWSFVAPGLTKRERRLLYLAMGSGGVLFLLGVFLAYLYAVPLALGYLLPLNQSLTGWENTFTGEGYVGFVATCCIAFGLAFELPLVMMALGWIGLITPEGVREWWRVVVLGVFVLAAIMTPPDPFSQLLLAVPMLGLFFLGYCLVLWTNRRTTEAEKTRAPRNKT